MLAPHHEPTVATSFRRAPRIDADGTVEGYASLFGEIDAARDMVMPGAFARTLKSCAASAACRCCSSTIRPSRSACGSNCARISAGLRARGKLIPEVGARARIARAVARRRGRRAVDRLSHREGAHRSGNPRAPAASTVDLWEISIVTFPLLAGARVRAVKQADPPRRSFHMPRARRAGGRTRGRRLIARSGDALRPPPAARGRARPGQSRRGRAREMHLQIQPSTRRTSMDIDTTPTSKPRPACRRTLWSRMAK